MEQGLAKINWNIISRAINYYQIYGYEYIEVPWIVSENDIRATLPTGRIHKIDNRALVGSAEQSFVHLMRLGLNNGNYVAASPCFRYDKLDDLHQETFFKVELIHIFSNKSFKSELDACIKRAYRFFNKNTNGKLEYVDTKIGTDIYLNSIEIGSYGCRSYNNKMWVYGTGIAEPRFSLASKEIK